jgi:CRP-like cAMP-binding protein
VLETTTEVPNRHVLRAADNHDEAPPPDSRVRLLDVIPEMHAAVPAAERLRAVQALTAPLVTVAAGEIALDGYDPARRPFALVVLDGLVLRRTTVAGREAAEALGPGDVIDLETHDEDDTVLPVHTRYVAHRTATLAVLDDMFRLAAHRWPRLHDVVLALMARQLHRTSRTLAILHLPRVEDRLVALFCELADRWGRVTPSGIVLDIRLTHHLLGELVGARRPTVSLALTELAHSGAVVRQEDRTWRISPALLDSPASAAVV